MRKKGELILPGDGDLPLTIDTAVAKLPGDAIHNRLHQMVEQMGATVEQLEKLQTPLVILAGLQLEAEFCSRVSRTKRTKGQGWAAWVKENCAFSRATADRYRRTIKLIRQGKAAEIFPALTADLLPETAPGDMSREQLADTVRALSGALDGVGRTQLYFELGLISAGNQPPTLTDSDETAREKVAREKAEADRDSKAYLKKWASFVTQKRHKRLPRPDRLALADSLERIAKDLRK